MGEWWMNQGESVKKAACFIAGVIVGGIGLSVLLN